MGGLAVRGRGTQVLDAPALQDDFYLNLVDWSAQNVLAVGLGGPTSPHVGPVRIGPHADRTGLACKRLYI